MSHTIIVTGRAGSIGTNFVRRCLAATEWCIVTLGKHTNAGDPGNIAERAAEKCHTFVRGDTCDVLLWKRLLATCRPLAVVNFAAESHVERPAEDADIFVQTNIVGVRGLLKAAHARHASLKGATRAAFRVLRVSTGEMFSLLELDAPAFSESIPYAPPLATAAVRRRQQRAWPAIRQAPLEAILYS